MTPNEERAWDDFTAAWRARAAVDDGRCWFCAKYDVPCGPDTHGNPLRKYLPLIETTHLTATMARPVPIIAREPTVRMSRPDYVPTQYVRTGELERRARLFDRVVPALIVLALILLSTIGAIAGLTLRPEHAGPPAACMEVPCGVTPTPAPPR